MRNSVVAILVFVAGFGIGYLARGAMGPTRRRTTPQTGNN
jgi:hypothetical protein